MNMTLILNNKQQQQGEEEDVICVWDNTSFLNRASHKLFFIKHSISTYLLPYEQCQIATTSKALRPRHPIRQSIALSLSATQTNIGDFSETFQSMDIGKLMQLKYTFIHLHKINGATVNKLNFASFMKPKMMLQPKEQSMDRLKYLCDILEHSHWSSSAHPIKEIDLSDNSLSDTDLSQIIDACEQNTSFANVTTLNLSRNMLIGVEEKVVDRLFNLIGSKMFNLEQLILSETGCDDTMSVAINKFIVKFPNHSLATIDLSKCEEITSLEEDNSRIVVIYDDVQTDATSELELEFGFDFNDTIDDEDSFTTVGGEDLMLKMEDSMRSGMNFVKMQSDEEFLSSDEDGFVYMDYEDIEW